ncbi:hypothetical protein ACTQ3Z_03695 [Lawsonibacter sp. LCP25S3_F5]
MPNERVQFDLTERVQKLRKLKLANALQVCRDSGAKKVLLHSISEGIKNAVAGLEKKKAEELRAFLYHTPDYEDICREILLVDYPEEVPHESAEALAELSWENILDEVFSQDGAKGVEMWRSLLDLAEPVLKKCQFYDDMDIHRRYKTLTWSNDEGQIVATCHSQQKRGETEETISSFTYYDPPVGRPDSAPPLVPPFGPSDSSGHTGSIRDDYDTPGDLWEENQDWYEDEDEAWDEWYDG